MFDTLAQPTMLATTYCAVAGGAILLGVIQITNLVVGHLACVVVNFAHKKMLQPAHHPAIIRRPPHSVILHIRIQYYIQY